MIINKIEVNFILQYYLSNNMASKTTGIVYYCFHHNKGCLVCSDKIPKNLEIVCFNECKKNNNCQWEDIGTFSVKNAKIVIHESNQSDELFYNNNLYDFSMKPINII